MQVVVNSLMTQYSRAGTGKTVLVLHGWGDSSRGWHGLQKDLQSDFDVVLVDLPGFGGSQAPPAAWSLDDYVDFVAAFLQKTGVAPYAIVGHSNGGAIAVKGLAEGKLKAARLVLLDSAGIRDRQTGRKKTLRLVTKTGKLLTWALPTSVKQGLRGRLYESIGSDMLVVGHMQETFKRVVAEDVQASASRLTTPTLLIYGEDDRDTPVDYGKTFQRLITGSRLETVAGAGHFSYQDKPQEVLRFIRKFLGRP